MGLIEEKTGWGRIIVTLVVHLVTGNVKREKTINI